MICVSRSPMRTVSVSEVLPTGRISLLYPLNLSLSSYRRLASDSGCSMRASHSRDDDVMITSRTSADDQRGNSCRLQRDHITPAWWWLSGYGVRFVICRSRVRLRAGPLPSIKQHSARIGTVFLQLLAAVVRYKLKDDAI